MLSEEEEDEEMDGGDVGSDNDMYRSRYEDVKPELFSQILGRQDTSH